MERIKNPDPDEHALASDDPIRLVVAPRSHLSESARVIYVERSLRLGTELFARPLAIAVFGAEANAPERSIRILTNWSHERSCCRAWAETSSPWTK